MDASGTDRDLIDVMSASAPSLASAADGGLALVARDGDFESRYRVWRGRSGRRYLVTVMPLGDAMRVESGVVLLVSIDPSGERHVVWAGEPGTPLPGIAVPAGVRFEAHVHLLAESSEKRAAALADLVDGAQSYSSVLTVRAAASQARVGSTTPRRSSSRAVLTT